MRKANGHRRINGGGFRRLMLRPWTSRKPTHGRAIHVDLVHMALVVRFFWHKIPARMFHVAPP